MWYRFAVLWVFSSVLASAAPQLPHRPVGLMVDLLTRPQDAVITHARPTFSWILEDDRIGAAQTAWQLLLASSPEQLEEGRADVWNSGKTLSSKSVSVTYGGPDLEAGHSYWWKVRTWNEQGGVGRWSEPQRFMTGSFDRSVEKWPGESLWVPRSAEGETRYLFEDRHPVEYHDYAPVSVLRNEAGNHFIAFEKAAFATLKLTLDVPEGVEHLTIHLGEKKTGGDSVDRKPGGSITYKKVKLSVSPGVREYLLELPRQISHYPNSQVLSEHMPEVAAFRYAEVEGWPKALEPEQVRQHALLYHFDEDAGDFQSARTALNEIWDLCAHTLKVTPFLGLYIDGTRERMPYEADAYLQQISHYCVDREFAIQRYTANFLIYNPSWPTEWHLHMVPMAWADYMATGDPRFLEHYYEELKKKTLLELAREDGLISTRTGRVTKEFLEGIHLKGKKIRDIVDWPQGTPANEEKNRSGHGSVRLAGETDRFIFSDINTVVNAFHYRNLVLMERIAQVLEKPEEAGFFEARAKQVKAAFNAKLFDPETGLYRDGEGIDHSSLHANMFPVVFGLVDEADYPKIREFLISKGMACSPYGAPYLLDALYEMGAADAALELLTSKSDRSWMNMIRFGTTITSEAWDLKYKRNMTWNHAWGASPVYIITRNLFGIRPLAPGFRRVEIRPRPSDMKRASIESPTIRGTIGVSFVQQPDVFTFELTIPANTTARLMLPLPEQFDHKLFINGEEQEFIFEEECVRVDHLPAGSYTVRVD